MTRPLTWPSLARPLSALAAVFALSACKGEAGACVITAAPDDEYARDSCDVSLKQSECVGDRKTFQPQESRDKAITYCLLQGFKAPPNEKDPSMYYRAREKK